MKGRCAVEFRLNGGADPGRSHVYICTESTANAKFRFAERIVQSDPEIKYRLPTLSPNGCTGLTTGRLCSPKRLPTAPVTIRGIPPLTVVERDRVATGDEIGERPGLS
jgi:hypothetical protein